jgi:hypothetical protein
VADLSRTRRHPVRLATAHHNRYIFNVEF